MLRIARLSSLLTAAGIAILVAGCAQSGAGATPTPATSVAGASAPASESAAGSGGALTVNVQQGSLGQFLTGAGGKSLYVFAKDTAGTSNCSGACAQNWPPLTVPAGQSAVAGTGVSGTLSTIARADGSQQVAVNGKPVYYYAGDSAAGETNGEGVQGLWDLAGPDGAPVMAPSSVDPYGY